MMTPARRKREMTKADEEQRRIDEEKYVGFSVACNNDDAHGCHSLAEWFAILRSDFGKAATIYKANCAERRYANSCFNLGVMYGAGRGVDKNTMLSMELFENGCKLGNGDACDLAGRSLLERSAQLQVGAAPTATSTTPAAAASTSSSLSSSTSPSTGLAEAALLRERGLTLLEHGCHDLENAPSCNFLGELFLVGRFGVEVDKKRAAPLLELACERFEMTACRNLMVMYSRGDGVERDFAKAEAYREQSIAAVQQQTGVNMPAFLQERFQKMQQRANAGPTRS